MHGVNALLDALTLRECEILRLLATGSSDREIAGQLFLSRNTVKWYNRQIYQKLGVTSRTQAIAQARRLRLLEYDSDEPLHSPSTTTIVLPAQTTGFIGRKREIAEVKRLLQTSRLLTLTGVGGTGKTRLALRVASEVADHFADGVYFVDLAPVSDAALVAKAIAGMLGVIENPNESVQDTLKRALSGRELLLLIDNFEHVIQAAPVLSHLLMAAPRLKVLVTSREALHLSGEQEYPVLPLSLPAAQAITIQNVTDSEAGSLFVQRAQMLLPRFEITGDNAPAIAQICTRLDGLPLAIELAAARCKLLSPQAMLARLDNRLTTLTGGSRDAPPRQQTLRRTLDWSYNLLDEGEKQLFTRLAVFRGGRSLEAIEAICGQDLPIDVFDGLAALVDKNLIQQKETAEGEPRFVMLETLHEYARERLEASGKAETIRRRHAEYFVELAERAEPELWQAQQGRWFQILEREHDNLRVVLEWSLGGDVAVGLRMAGALWYIWRANGHHAEGYHWTQQLLQRMGEAPVTYHAKFLVAAGRMAVNLSDLPTAKRLFRESLEISRKLGDKRQTAWALTFMSQTLFKEMDKANAMAEEGLSLFRELDYQPGIQYTLNLLGEIARVNGDDRRARSAYEEALALAQQMGDIRRTCVAFTNLSFIDQHERNHKGAVDRMRQALMLCRQMKYNKDMVNFIQILAGSLGAVGEPERAARLFGAGEVALERMGAFIETDQFELDRNIAAVRSQLDDATFKAAWAEGRAMTLEQAAREALGE